MTHLLSKLLLRILDVLFALGNEASSGLLTQLLFSYRLDAQTVFLAGYSDNYAGTEVVDLTQTNRAVFLKLSYAWLF